MCGDKARIFSRDKVFIIFKRIKSNIQESMVYLT